MRSCIFCAMVQEGFIGLMCGKGAGRGVPLGGGRRYRLCFCFRPLYWGIPQQAEERVDVRVLQPPPCIISDPEYWIRCAFTDGLQSSQSRRAWVSILVEAALPARRKSIGNLVLRYFEARLCSTWELLRAEDGLALCSELLS